MGSFRLLLTPSLRANMHSSTINGGRCIQVLYADIHKTFSNNVYFYILRVKYIILKLSTDWKF